MGAACRETAIAITNRISVFIVIQFCENEVLVGILVGSFVGKGKYRWLRMIAGHKLAGAGPEPNGAQHAGHNHADYSIKLFYSVP